MQVLNISGRVPLNRWVVRVFKVFNANILSCCYKTAAIIALMLIFFAPANVFRLSSASTVLETFHYLPGIELSTLVSWRSRTKWEPIPLPREATSFLLLRPKAINSCECTPYSQPNFYLIIRLGLPITSWWQTSARLHNPINKR